MRLLIVSPHFPPVNAADMQRIRMIIPYLAEAGIRADVLAVRSDDVASPLDPWLASGVPDDIQVHRVKAIGLRWTKIPALGTLGFRALQALQRAGDSLLANEHFDLVYFSTTVFPTHLLGPRWRRRFGVPFVMDYQDPWVSDYYQCHPEVDPPGGRLKFAFADFLNRWMEPRVLRACSGITSVSAAYPQQLAERYGSRDSSFQPTEIKVRFSELRLSISGMRSIPSFVLPFPGDFRDFDRVKGEGVKQSLFSPEDGSLHWIYVGRGGEDMQIAVRSLFSAIQATVASQSPGSVNLVLHFIGTSYAAPGQGLKTIEPLAEEYGLKDFVKEHTDRIPYSEALRCLLDADALIVLGSDDSGYTASKIYPYLLAEKPLLAVFHEESSVVSLIELVGGGRVVRFRSGETPSTIGERIVSEVFSGELRVSPVELDRSKIRSHLARYQATEISKFFRSIIEG